MPQHQTVIGVDLGGTKTDAARYDAVTWELQEKERIPTMADRAFGHVLDDTVNVVERLRDTSTVAVGLGIPGLVHQPDGTVLMLPNIPGAEGSPLKRQMEERLKLPVAVENDANCFTLAEALYGAGRGQEIVVGITLGTGVGGGIVMHGDLFRGSHGYAAEIGHMLLQPGLPPFATEDKRGDAEQFLSGSAMGKRCAQAKDPKQYLQGETCSFLHPALFQELAWLCTNITHLLDPSVLVLGGSAGKALKPHMQRIKQELLRWLLPGTPAPAIAMGELQEAATMGAALLAKPLANL